MDEKRVATGVAGLDEMLGGGLVPGSTTLVRGAPGTGKTTLAFHFLAHGAAHGEPGLLVSFEEFPESLYRDAEALGWDLRQMEQDNMLHIMFTSPDVFLRGLQNHDGPVTGLMQKRGIERVAVDSLTHYVRLTPDTHELRKTYNTVVNGLKREQVTSLFLGEEANADYTTGEKGRLSFIVDCIIMMRYLEIESAIQRAILVLKMRSSQHDKAIRSYTISKGGITIGKALEGHSGLLSGLIRRSMISPVE
jgi:circadian clock protein KaiC